MSLREAGYRVVVNADASGTFDTRIAQYPVNRMQAAGVQVMNFFAIQGELFRGWRSTNLDAATTVPFRDKYITAGSFVLRSHGAALQNGTLVPGEASLLAVDTNDNASSSLMLDL